MPDWRQNKFEGFYKFGPAYLTPKKRYQTLESSAATGTFLSVRVQILLRTPSVSNIFIVLPNHAISTLKGTLRIFSRDTCSRNSKTICGWNVLQKLMETVFQGHIRKLLLLWNLDMELHSRNFLAVFPKIMNIILAISLNPCTSSFNSPLITIPFRRPS